MSQPASLARPKVYSIAIELTAYCNQKCDYCYNEWRDDNGASLDSADTEQLLGRTRKLLEQLEIDHFTLTGGEPFSRADVWQLLDLTREHRVGVQIISNGGLITERIAKRLAPYDVRYVQVTLNGPDAALHEEHVGEGHFEKTLRGIRALTAEGVPVVGCVVVTRKNAAVLSDILRLFHDLGVKHIALSRFSPAGYAASYAAQLLPSRSDIMEAFAGASTFAREHGMRISCTMPIPPCMLELEDYAPIEFGFCPIGTAMQEFALGPDGSLRNCTLHGHDIGGVRDILHESVDLTQLIRDADVTEYRKKLPEFCEGCAYADSCGGGCGAAALWTLHGDSEFDDKRKPDPFLWQHMDDDFEAQLQKRRADGRHHLEVIL